MKKIFLIFILVNMLFGLNQSKEFSIIDGKIAKIEVINSSLYVIFGMTTKQKITDLNRNIVIISSGQEFELFRIEDYNFDGFMDISVLVDIGLMGVNLFYDYYLYYPNQKRYTKSISNISNLRINKQSYELISSLKSKNSYITTVYKIKDSKPYIAMKREAFMQNGLEKIQIFDENKILQKSSIIPKYDKIKTKKAYFYKTPNGVKTKRYIIKDDKVKLLDIDMENKMVFIEFKGKEIFHRWIKLESISKP